MRHHGAGLRALTGDDRLVDALAADWRAALLSDADRAMLAYATKLNREPWAVREPDVAGLREAGFDDRAILDIAQVTAYYAFANRLADGLGVELEPFWDRETGDETKDEAAQDAQCETAEETKDEPEDDVEDDVIGGEADLR